MAITLTPTSNHGLAWNQLIKLMAILCSICLGGEWLDICQWLTVVFHIRQGMNFADCMMHIYSQTCWDPLRTTHVYSVSYRDAPPLVATLWENFSCCATPMIFLTDLYEHPIICLPFMRLAQSQGYACVMFYCLLWGYWSIHWFTLMIFAIQVSAFYCWLMTQ